MISAEEYGRLRRGPAKAEVEAGQSVAMPTGHPIDTTTRTAAEAFLARIGPDFKRVAALLFGSRARGTHAPDSDVDIAVVLKGKPGNRYRIVGPLADAAYDVFMETGVYIQPLLLWESELKRPELFDNPALIENVKREGIQL